MKKIRIRLYRGPFNGKVMEHPWAGSTELVVNGPKPMTRKQRYEWEREQYQNLPYDFILDKSGKVRSTRNRFPQVTASYRLCRDLVTGQPMRHPDGSIFYEWTGEKR